MANNHCNLHQGNGHYVIYLDGREIIKGSRLQFQKKHTIQVDPRYEDEMSERDSDWLRSHNERRKKYHEEFGASYVPLQWSPKLAEQAKTWAVKLLDHCHVGGLQHEQNVAEGENLAKNMGNGSWGKEYPTDNIVSRWVENERFLGYPKNAHMTQVSATTAARSFVRTACIIAYP